MPGSTLGPTVGPSPGAGVGSSDGSSPGVGSSPGAGVGSSDGSSPGVGSSPGAGVGSSVGSSPGAGVGSSVGSSPGVGLSQSHLVPMRMICLTGSFVRSVVTSGSPEGLPSTIFCVEVTTSLPLSPCWSMTCLPDSRVSSVMISVSNGIGRSIFVTTDVPSARGPYSTMRGFGSLVVTSERVDTLGTPPSSIVASNLTVMVFSPNSPSCTTLTSPGARSGLGRMMVS
ncbi:Uncharacterised protein [Mycobacteroides abscessus subsp. abscessus]|nr:Uncharacterised protein [Mycobacteroides abscessus subsp. abscessus]